MKTNLCGTFILVNAESIAIPDADSLKNHDFPETAE
jgi:hypothetical protein